MWCPFLFFCPCALEILHPPLDIFNYKILLPWPAEVDLDLYTLTVGHRLKWALQSEPRPSIQVR